MKFNSSMQSIMYRLPREVTEYVHYLVATGKNRDSTVTVALAMSASTLINIPTAPVDDPQAYYLSQAGDLCMNFINAINGILPVDFRAAVELSRKLFSQRYESATMPFANMTTYGGCGIEKIFGLNKHIPADILETMEKSGDDIIRHYRRFEELKAALRQE